MTGRGLEFDIGFRRTHLANLVESSPGNAQTLQQPGKLLPWIVPDFPDDQQEAMNAAGVNGDVWFQVRRLLGGILRVWEESLQIKGYP
ncbi:hypothetical protein JCM31598_31250 [Desulfonatronum parangueonense]